MSQKISRLICMVWRYILMSLMAYASYCDGQEEGKRWVSLDLMVQSLLRQERMRDQECFVYMDIQNYNSYIRSKRDEQKIIILSQAIIEAKLSIEPVKDQKNIRNNLFYCFCINKTKNQSQRSQFPNLPTVLSKPAPTISHHSIFKLEYDYNKTMKKVSSDLDLSSSPLLEPNSLDKYQIRSKPTQPPTYNRQILPHCDYGALNQYKLDDLINLQGDGFSQGSVVRLAFIQNHSIHLQEAAIQTFQKYAKNQIAFTAVYGKSQSGKSLLVDKLINLTEVEGSHLTRKKEQLKGIYLWSVPFTKGNTKIFMLDIDGYAGQVDQDYLMLLSFMMFLTSSLMLVSAPQDLQFQELTTLYKHLKKAKQQFISEQQSQIQQVWPQNLYCLFRGSVNTSKALQSLRAMFKNFHFKVITDAMEERYSKEFTNEDLKDVSMKRYNARKKMLSQGYISRISSLFRHIHGQIAFKSFTNFRFTGANLTKLAINAVQSLNVKGHLHLGKIFQRSMKELYLDAYNFHTQLYNEHLAGYLNDEKPFEVDYLISAFKDTQQLIYKSFNNLTICPELKQSYGEKLERYINVKEKMILAINKKKSTNQVKEVIPAAKPEIVKIDKFIKEAKESPKYLEQVYANQMVPFIANVIKDVEQKRKTQEDSQGKAKKDIIESKITEKEGELEQLRKTKEKKSSIIQQSLSRKEYFDNKERQLNDAVRMLKQQLALVKKNQPQKKQAQQKPKSPEQLQLQQQKLRKEVKLKQKTIQQLKTQAQRPASQEQIQLLTSQIQQKVQKQRQLQSALASNIPKLQSIQTFRSSSKLASPRRVQSRVFKSQNPNIRVISSPKN